MLPLPTVTLGQQAHPEVAYSAYPWCFCVFCAPSHPHQAKLQLGTEGCWAVIQEFNKRFSGAYLVQGTVRGSGHTAVLKKWTEFLALQKLTF